MGEFGVATAGKSGVGPFEIPNYATWAGAGRTMQHTIFEHAIFCPVTNCMVHFRTAVFPAGDICPACKKGEPGEKIIKFTNAFI